MNSISTPVHAHQALAPSLVDTILVPEGEIKILLKASLNNAGNEFLLFPNLYPELQDHIFKFAALAEPRKFRMMEIEKDVGNTIVVVGAPRPNIIKASKRALEVAIQSQQYVALFATTSRSKKLYFNESIDVVQMECYLSEDASCGPHLNAVDFLITPLDMSAIRILNTDLIHFYMNPHWANTNIAMMSKLETLHITGVLEDAGRTAPGTFFMVLEDIHKNRNGYVPFFRQPDGVELSVMDALEAFASNIVHPYQQRALFETYDMLNHCLKYTPNFPMEVFFIPTYVPVEGF